MTDDSVYTGYFYLELYVIILKKDP